MNVLDSSALRECTSCQMCAAVCPRKAIEILLDEEGFYRPSINSDRCTNCSLCVNVCYKFDKDIAGGNLEGISLYAAAADKDTLSNTSSGGVADLLARQLTNEGYTCIGVGYDNEKGRAFHYVAHTPEETTGFRGSKYIQAYSFPAFRELVDNCNRLPYAVFGTPCQIYAIHRYLNCRKIRERVLLIDLFCHGCPSLLLWRKYMHEIKTSTGASKFDRLDFRSKNSGWGNFSINVMVQGRKVFQSKPGKDPFYTLFFSNQLLNAACTDCRLRSTMAYTDIRLGDFWGRQYASNRQGVSAVCPVTDSGRKAFESLLPALTLHKKHTFDEFLPWQSYGRKYQNNLSLRKIMLEQLSDKDLPLRKTIQTFYRHQDLKSKLKRHLKQILPSSILLFIKRLH